MKGRRGDRKEKVKVNFNNFDWQMYELEWVEKNFRLTNNISLNFLLPYSPHASDRPDVPDLRNAEVVSFGIVNDRVKPERFGHYVWWGAIKNKKEGERETFYPLILEFPDSILRKHGKVNQLVSTPPGRPGNPTTILADLDGEIVPDLYFPNDSKVKVLFLSRNWESMGWRNGWLFTPAIALQFLEGECSRNKLTIANWQAYLMRNKA